MHYGTIVEHVVLVAIGGTAVPTLQNYRRRLKRVKQLISKSPRPLLITFSRQLSRETVVTPPSDHVQDDDDNDDKDKDKRHESDDDTTATTTTNSTTTTITTTTITTTRTMTNAPITTSTDIVNPSFIRNVTRLPLLSLAPAPVPTPTHDGYDNDTDDHSSLPTTDATMITASTDCSSRPTTDATTTKR